VKLAKNLAFLTNLKIAVTCLVVFAISFHFLFWAFSMIVIFPPMRYSGVTRSGHWELVIELKEDRANNVLIGRARLNSLRDVRYLDEIVSVELVTDFRMVEPLVQRGYLDLESGYFYLSNGDWAFVRQLRGDVRMRNIECEVVFFLQNGARVRETVTVTLQGKSVFGMLVQS